MVMALADLLQTLGDLDNDGIIELAVGADGDDAGGPARGALHILFLNSNGSVKSTVEINSDTNGLTLSDGDEFGSSVANLGDLDGDGIIELAVGATGGDLNRGTLYILFLNRDGSVCEVRVKFERLMSSLSQGFYNQLNFTD